MSDVIGKYFKRKNIETKVHENIKRFFSNILHCRAEYTDKKAKKYIDKAILKYMKTKPYECIGYIPVIVSTFKMFYDDMSLDFYDIVFVYSNRNGKYFLDRFYDKVKQFMFEKYEIDTYEKKVINDMNDWKWISKKFAYPFRFPTHDIELMDSKGVVFYKENILK